MSGRKQKQGAFTGRTRRKKTALSVRLGDVVARVLITVGGIGTIVAVCFVFIYLGFKVLPLFSSPELSEPAAYEAEWAAKLQSPEAPSRPPWSPPFPLPFPQPQSL